MEKFKTGSGLENSSPNKFLPCALIFFGVILMYLDKYMKMAIQEAKKAYVQDEVPIGAIIVKNDEIIAYGHNMKEKEQLVTSHAELIAIQKANNKLSNWRLDGCDMYITLEPCPMCASAIQQARINTVYYGTSCSDEITSSIVQKIFENVDRNRAVMSVDCKNSECRELLQTYFKKKRK